MKQLAFLVTLQRFATETLLCALATASLCIATPSLALDFDPYYTPGLVLQANTINPIHGTGTPGETVRLTFGPHVHTDRVGSDGIWSVRLDPLPPNDQPATISVVGSRSGEASCSDVLVGDVWLLAGQSNMSFPLSNSLGGSDAADESGSLDSLRLLLYEPAGPLGGEAWTDEHNAAITPRSFFTQPHWARAGKQSSPPFSGVGFFFGRYLQYAIDTPIGLVQVAIGGTPIESWIPRRDIERNPLLQSLVQDYPFSPIAHSFVSARSRMHLGLAWDQDKAARRGTDLSHPYAPGFMFQAAIEPLQDMPFAGIIWYQGESNAHDGARYATMFKALLRSWKSTLGRTKPPILLVQLPELNRPEWPEFRETQQQIADRNALVTLVPALGLGHPSDVHPKKKRQLGERLARTVIALKAGRDATAPTIAIDRATDRTEGALRLVVANTPSGVRAGGTGDLSRAFLIAGRDKVFHPADQVQVDGTTITVHSNAVERPLAVRYAWEAEPEALLLRNRDDLPVLPYRSDEWSAIRVACCGDSITEGIGLSRTYPQALSDQVGPLFDVRNFGRSGATVQSAIVRSGWRRGYGELEEFYRSLAFQPDLVILNLGINDSTKTAFDRETFTREYIHIVQAYQALKSKPKIFLWAPLAPLFQGQTYYGHPVGNQIQAAIAQVARRTGAHLIDMRTDLLNSGHLFPDNLHPNTEGATEVARITHRALDDAGLPVMLAEGASKEDQRGDEPVH